MWRLGVRASHGPGAGTRHGDKPWTRPKHGDNPVGPAVGFRHGDQPWGLPVAVGLGGRTTVPLLPSSLLPGTPLQGQRCSGWGARCCPDPCPASGFCFSFSTHFYFPPKAASCHLQTLPPPVLPQLPPLPSLPATVPLSNGKCHCRVFGPPHRVAAGPTRVCALPWELPRQEPQQPPSVRPIVLPSGAVQLLLPRLTW